jgi:hypothetical protein
MGWVDWTDRVAAEKAELDGRLAALEAFIGTDRCNDLDFEARCLLARQRVLMKQLSSVLGDRLKLAGVA